jgi:glycerol uptake facilitator-like aquaporin
VKGELMMKKVMIKLLFTFILLALGACTSLAISVAGDFASL